MQVTARRSEKFFSEYRQIVIPVMLQGLVTNLVAMVDNLMVGQLGDDAISAVAVSNRILNIVMFTVLGISAAASVFIAQYFGARNKEKQKEVFRIAIILSCVVYFIAATILWVFPVWIIHFFVQVPQVEVLAQQYIALMVMGFFPLIVSINYSTTLKVVGQVRLPLVASLCGVAVNTFLNYVLIFGNFGAPQLGVQGAAIATITARSIELAIIMLFTMRYHFDFNTTIRGIFKIDRTLLRDVMKKAAPLASNEIIWAFGMATILKIYGSRGSEVIAAYSIYDTTATIFFSISQGMSAATPVLVSQRLGANKFDEAYGNALAMLKTIVIVSIVLGVFMWGSSYIIPTLYQVSAISHQLATHMIQLSSVLFWIYLINTQCYFIIRAGGDMKSTLMIDGAFMWGFTIPIMALTAYFTPASIFMIYIVGQLCDFVKMNTSLWFFSRKRWLRNLTLSHIA